MSFFKGSSELPPSDHDDKPTLTEEELAAFEKLAKKVVVWDMTAPAIVFLESVKPLNFIASQTMVFFEPIVQSIFSFSDYENFRTALEKRESIEILLKMIEEHDAVAQARKKRVKKWLKQEKKKWKWYQRYLGIFLPKINPPDDVLNPPEEKKPDEPEKK